MLIVPRWKVITCWSYISPLLGPLWEDQWQVRLLKGNTMRHQFVSLGPEFLSNFQLEYFVCLLLKTTKNFSWSPKSGVRSASREEGLELSDTSCATGQKARSLGHSFTELSDLKCPCGSKTLYFWIVPACTQFGSVEKEMTQKCNRGKSEGDSDFPYHNRCFRHRL